jgi:hypothetical protein
MSTRQPDDPLDAALAICRVLELGPIPYAIGGALAFGLWGVPRATVDVDLNIFTEDDRLDEVVAALDELGISCDISEIRTQAEREGRFVLRHGAFRIDVFTPSIEFAWEAERTRVLQTVEGQDVWFLSAEALAVFKLLFFRPKDIVDLERLVAVQGERLDVGYVRQHMVAMMGEDDPRVSEWDRLVALHQS